MIWILFQEGGATLYQSIIDERGGINTNAKQRTWKKGLFFPSDRTTTDKSVEKVKRLNGNT
jgi:hypothetical protein